MGKATPAPQSVMFSWKWPIVFCVACDQPPLPHVRRVCVCQWAQSCHRTLLLHSHTRASGDLFNLSPLTRTHSRRNTFLVLRSGISGQVTIRIFQHVLRIMFEYANCVWMHKVTLAAPCSWRAPSCSTFKLYLIMHHSCEILG